MSSRNLTSIKAAQRARDRAALRRGEYKSVTIIGLTTELAKCVKSCDVLTFDTIVEELRQRVTK